MRMLIVGALATGIGLIASVGVFLLTRDLTMSPVAAGVAAGVASSLLLRRKGARRMVAA